MTKTTPTPEALYEAFRLRLEEIERERGCYLADYMVDEENVQSRLDEGEFEKLSDDFWAAMLAAAQDAAGYRAIEAGFDINDHFDRIIY